VIVDAHHHFWDPARAHYPWLTEDLAPIRRAFGPADLAPSLASTGVEATVLVQTRSSVEETEEFLATAAATPFIRGVVGWVDLRDPGVDDAIARLRERPGGGRLVGIRHQVHDEEDPAWLLRQDVRRGIAAVGRAGLVYDLLVRTRELPAAHEVVTAMPDVRFVVDHLAKPPIRDGTLRPWADEVDRFADLPNASWKLSGLVTEADWATWQPADLRPFVDHVLTAVGPERVMFGSDWPVCLLAATYEGIVATARALLEGAGLNDQEQAAVLGDNAVAVYGL
jgi:L-fuconolactonase